MTSPNYEEVHTLQVEVKKTINTIHEKLMAIFTPNEYNIQMVVLSSCHKLKVCYYTFIDNIFYILLDFISFALHGAQTKQHTHCLYHQDNERFHHKKQ